MWRAAILALGLAAAMLLGILRADQATGEAGLLARWPAEASAEEQVFDGGQFIALTPAPNVGTGPFSVSVWVNAADLSGGDPTYGRGIARSTHKEQVGDWLLAVHPDGRLRFCNWRKTGDDGTGGHVTRSPVIQPDAWYQIVAAWDGKANHLFVNGGEVPFTDGATATGWETGHEVGRSWTQPGYHWDGRIDDLRVYGRVLTAAEIKAAAQSPPRRASRQDVKPAGDLKVSDAIDREILARLREQNLTPAPAADDAEYHRRVMLDLAGRVPTTAETEAFLADRTSDKRDRLIDTLLAGREMPVYWAQVLSGWMMPKESRRDPLFVGYLRHGLAKNKSWDRFAREMLIARPTGTADQGATAFLRYRKAALADGTIARDVGRAFFGVNLRCAQCHDHPHVPEWTREHFFGLAAFFARSFDAQANSRAQPGLPLGEKDSGELEYIAFGGKKKVARLLFLDGTVVTEPAAPLGRREALARVALAPQSPYFKRALVNRVWRQLLGRALVEPVDMIHDGNPATHPHLLDLLADDFADHGFNLRRLLTVIMQSQTYARSSRWPGTGKVPDETFYAVAVLKPLDADQFALSLPLATGYYDDPLAAQKGNLSQVRSVAPWKEIIAEFESQGEDFEPTAAQALFLLNSDYVQTNFLARSNLVQALGKIPEETALAQRLYLSVLARLPSPEEAALVGRYLADRGTGSREEACRELVWALLSGAEFRFNH
jgi:hypothetical protein